MKKKKEMKINIHRKKGMKEQWTVSSEQWTVFSPSTASVPVG